jgi:dTDP-4-amino-4,6-dideoxygalactose transaminase
VATATKAAGSGVDFSAVPVPLMDIRGQYAELLPEIKQLVCDVIDSGRFILGPNVRALESEFAATIGYGEAVAVANGTDALELSLQALGVGRDDEVITTPYTFYATAEAIARTGATPVFADIDPATLNLDPEDVAARVTDRTRALMPVHLFGRVMPLGELAKLGIPIVEDAAQAFGAEGVATTGELSTFSFFPTKNLFALGDGGLVGATDEELADRIALLRFHGSREKKNFEAVGYNSRLDELQAAVLRLFLGELAGWNRARREAAARYEELGLGELCELPLNEPGHVYHMYVVRSPERDRLREALAAAEIGNASYYVTPLHLQPALRYLGVKEGSLPETEKAAAENLALPMWAGIPAEVQEQVVAVIREAAAVRA